MTFSGRPAANEFGEFFQGYVDKVDSEDVVSFLVEQLHNFQTVFANTTEEAASQLHPPYTWSIKQVIGHLIDGEKIFGYRLHRIAVGDKTALPGFDHEPYVDNLDYNDVTLVDLVAEFAALRQAHLLFMKRLPESAWQQKGTASDADFSVRGKAFVMAGHVQHHLEIMKKRLENG